MTATSYHAYLYSLWNDQFTVTEGTVVIFCGNRRAHAKFECDARREYITVDPAPSKISKAKLWLHERDDELARRLLIEYHEECIADLKKKLTGHEQKLDILKGPKR